MQFARSAADNFIQKKINCKISPYGSGNVNDTFLVELENSEKFILQKINQEVFSKPELIMDNLSVISDHLQIKGQSRQIPGIVKCRDNKNYFIDSKGSFWRALEFIENAATCETIQDMHQAKEAGIALGRFHLLISDIDTTKFHDTLPGFHITPQYLQQYDEAYETHSIATSAEFSYCQNMITEMRPKANVLEDAKETGELIVQPIHGDPKVSNIMFNKTNGKAVCMIDLDTVKPGLIHYDIGDCLRSCCNKAGEETDSPDNVSFDIDICRAILDGYISHAKTFLTKNDFRYFYSAIRLIPFELGLRFITDFLKGNIYFHTYYPDQNLKRAMVQFKLVESIEMQKNKILSIIDNFS